MNSFAAHIAPICGWATSMRRTLKAPTITFSTQKSSRVANTVQPKNRTPASGTRFAATSVRALGESRTVGRGRGRSGTSEVTVSLRCRVEAMPPRACRPRRGTGSWRRERLDPGAGRGGDRRQPIRDIQVAPAGGVGPGAARGTGGNNPDRGSGGTPCRRAARPGNEPRGGGGTGRGDAGTDHRRRHAGLPRDLQRTTESVLRPAAAGQPDREGRRTARVRSWRRPLCFDRPRNAPAVREPRRDGRGERGVRDERPVRRR